MRLCLLTLEYVFPVRGLMAILAISGDSDIVDLVRETITCFVDNLLILVYCGCEGGF